MQVNCACRVPNASGGFPHGLSFLPAKIWQLWVTLMIIAPEASLIKMLFFPVSPHSRAHALRLSARTDGTKKISVFGCFLIFLKKKEKVCRSDGSDRWRTGWKCQWKQLGKGFFFQLIQIYYFQFKVIWINTWLLWLFLLLHLDDGSFFFGLHYTAFWCLATDGRQSVSTCWVMSEMPWLFFFSCSCSALLYCDLQDFLLTCGIMRAAKYIFFIFVLKGDRFRQEFPG